MSNSDQNICNRPLSQTEFFEQGIKTIIVPPGLAWWMPYFLMGRRRNSRPDLQQAGDLTKRAGCRKWLNSCYGIWSFLHGVERGFCGRPGFAPLECSSGGRENVNRMSLHANSSVISPRNVLNVSRAPHRQPACRFSAGQLDNARAFEFTFIPLLPASGRTSLPCQARFFLSILQMKFTMKMLECARLLPV